MMFAIFCRISANFPNFATNLPNSCKGISYKYFFGEIVTEFKEILENCGKSLDFAEISNLLKFQ